MTTRRLETLCLTTMRKLHGRNTSTILQLDERRIWANVDFDHIVHPESH